jgi:hypothetical protein
MHEKYSQGRKCTRPRVESTSERILPAGKVSRPRREMHLALGLPSLVSWLVLACGLLLRPGLVDAQTSAGSELRRDIGELTAGRIITQPLVATEDCLEAIDLVVTTYGRKNACCLDVLLRDEVTGQAVAERHLSCGTLADGTAFRIGFPLQLHSRGRKYLLTLMSDGKAGQAVTLRLVRDGRFQGEATEGNHHYGADLDISLVYRYGANSNYIETWRRMRLRWLKLAGILAALTFIGHLALSWRKRPREATGAGLAWAAVGFGRWLREHRFEVMLSAGVFVLHQLAAPHQQFVDEYDAMSGGMLVKRGLVPYKDFFSHHMPLPYFVAAGIMLFTGSDLWALRSVFQFLLFLWSLGIYGLMRRHVGRGAAVLFVLLAPLAMLRCWGFMLLGETLIAYSSVSLLVLCLFRFRAGQHVLTRTDVAAVSLLTSIIALGSLAWVYFGGLVYAWFGWKYLTSRTWKVGGPTPGTAAALLALPYALFLLFLVATHSVRAFHEDNFSFNMNYYAQFNSAIPDGNPVTALADIVVGVLQKAGSIPSHLLQPEYCGTVYALLAGIAMASYLAYCGRLGDAAFFTSAFILVGPRGGLGEDWLNQYHAQPYILVAVLVGSIAAFKIPEVLQAGEGMALRIVYGMLVPFFALTFVGSLGYAASIYWSYWKNPSIYMLCRTEPFAEIINAVTDKHDYVWVAPLQLQTVVHLRARPATYYPYFLPWVAIQEGAQERVIHDLQTHQAKVVFWVPNQNIWNYDVDAFSRNILDYLDAHYFIVDNSRDERLRLLRFPKARRGEILQELARLGYLAP